MTLKTHPWRDLARAIDSNDPDEARRAVESLDSPELARSLDHLASADVGNLLRLLDVEVAAEVLDRLPEAQAAEVVRNVRPDTAAEILGGLPVREQADVLDGVDPDEAEDILEAMAVGAAEPLRALHTYADGTAGSLMDPQFLSFDSATTLRSVVFDLQAGADEFRDYQVQYIHTTDEGRLAGIVPLREVLFRPPETTLEEIALAEVVKLRTSDDFDKVAQVFEDHNFVGVPVVDDHDRLRGVVHRSAVERATAEASESDYLKAQGIVGGEELRSQPLLRRSRRRLSWLSVNILLNVAAASVIAFYQETLAAVIALAAFLPIISDMSGCSGNQAVAVSMRELALGIATPRDALHVWRRELPLALLNGLALGTLLAGVAWVWQQNVFLSWVVGLALALNTVIAVSIGAVVPLLLKRMKLDPALASGPILTTVTDLSGFLLALGLATELLGQITRAG